MNLELLETLSSPFLKILQKIHDKIPWSSELCLVDF